MTTSELSARQSAALAAVSDKNSLILALKESQKTLLEKIAILEAAGNDITDIRAQLAVSNQLLQELQDAVLADVETPAPVPASEPEPEPAVDLAPATEAPADETQPA